MSPCSSLKKIVECETGFLYTDLTVLELAIQTRLASNSCATMPNLNFGNCVLSELICNICMCRSDNLWESVLSFKHLGPRHKTQVVRFGDVSLP